MAFWVSAAPGDRIGSGGNRLGSSPTRGSLVTSSSIPRARPERIRPPRWQGPTPPPVYPTPKCTRPPSKVPNEGTRHPVTSIGPPHAHSRRAAARGGEIPPRAFATSLTPPPP